MDERKLNPKLVLQDKSQLTYEPDGTPHRMWGLKEDSEKVLGFDVEERLWEVIVEEACRDGEGGERCRELRAFVREVFGWMGSIPRPW